MNLLVFSEIVEESAGIGSSLFGDDPCESGSSELEVWGRSRVGDRRVFW